MTNAIAGQLLPLVLTTSAMFAAVADAAPLRYRPEPSQQILADAADVAFGLPAGPRPPSGDQVLAGFEVHRPEVLWLRDWRHGWNRQWGRRLHGAGHHGSGGPFDGSAAAVPLPGAVWLFGTALVALLGGARRHRPSAGLRRAWPRLRMFVVAAVSAAGIALTSANPVGAAPVFESDDQEMLYYWGTALGQQLDQARVTNPEDIEWITRGIRDRVAGKAPDFGEEYPSLLNNYLVRRTREAAEAEAVRARDYVKEMAGEPGAVRTDSGLVYREIAPGAGERPTKDSTVTVHYTGTLRDGRVFDSSRERGAPLQTRLTAVIPCWSEAIPMMRPGGRARITCPPELAYGERGNARIPGGSALTFDVELLEVDN